MAELFAKYNCTNCQDDIPGIRVHCAECIDFDLCLQCFAAGAEIGTHRNDHSYEFMDTGILSIYRGKNAWSGREELHLLDAIEKYGYGNWEDISKHIETRSPEDAKEEYISRFLSGTIGRLTWIPASDSQRPNLVDHTEEPDNGPLGSNLVQKMPPLEVTLEEAAQLGYMPNRDDFEREYDPSAEQLVSTLTLNPDDEDVDLLLKLAQVDMYTRRLRERARRKRLVRDYQLVANFFRGSSKRSRHSRDQREFRDRFRVFAQFFTSHEYERLLASLERERELRVRLSELSRYRWNGLTSIAECVHFEQHAAASNHRNTGPYGHGRTDTPATGSRQDSCLPSPQNKRQAEGAAGVERKSLSSIGQKVTLHTGDQTSLEGSSPSKNFLDNYRGSSGLSNQTTMTPTTQSSYQAHQQQQQNGNTVAASPKQQLQQHLQQQQDHKANANLQSMNSSPIVTNQIQQTSQNPKQLGENLLSLHELQLCTSLNLPPTRYMTLKTILLSGAPLSSLSNVEILIRKYLIKAGWLSN